MNKGFSTILGIIIGLVIIGGGMYFFVSNEGVQDNTSDILENEMINTETEVANGQIDGMQFTSGSHYLDCAEYESADCSYPDEKFKTVITPLIVKDINNDSTVEIVYTASSIHGNNFGTPEVWILEKSGTDTFTITEKIELEEKGGIKLVSAENGLITLEIDASWKGQGTITQTIDLSE